MPDFLTVLTREKQGRKGGTDVYPAFLIRKSRDLMIRGQDFYAVWLEDEKRWSTDEQDALDLIDRYLDEWYEANKVYVIAKNNLKKARKDFVDCLLCR